MSDQKTDPVPSAGSGGTVPTVFLQEHLWHGALDLRWWDYAAWGVYVSYFLATYLLAGFLWFVARDRFRRYVAAVSLLALMGFATYALFPAAPPWMASSLGELEPTTRTIGIVAGQLPWLDFSTLFERGAEYANPVAAVPSLHAAYTLLFAITHDELSGPVNVTGPAPVTNAEFTTALGRALNRPTPLAVPGFVLRAALGEFADEGVLGGQRAIPEALERAGFQFHHNTIGEALAFATAPHRE